MTNIVENYLLPELVLVDVFEDTRGNYIRIIIDSERAVTLADTTKLSKKLRDDEEIDARFPNGFRLEVSTPGLDQPLAFPFQYRKNINRQLNVVFMEGEESKTITGKVMGADESSVTLMDSGQEIVLSFDQIKSAKVKVSFNKP
ncbi:MAG: hypothetical protein HOK94_01890 [Candidatus Marinimicrobia bacterium]|nr:hypothetical protein [Candidatus Neomarinimicrobiota bacterium]MBT3502258.1 hypothetical protein [Candidatus Neomarinimicrobiota bacterium]MBT4283134.1 hypothetical protein [Candidatus Neomarinimicrobiota bacterium]MBT5460380.1 hypothetical protein [Candidatus Neomarinimicrobiota bacterium]MBT5758711.1 hypothetical protein [Candidatus Neomarinimicrobiota bacterium]